MNDTLEEEVSIPEKPERKRLNVLCFVLDQLRYDCLGCYGDGVVKTPNIDRLARAGVVFDRAYVANPLCMPARATFFTGLAPRHHGVRSNGIPLQAEVPTMTEALRQAGYHTHSVGKLHLSPYHAAKDVKRPGNASCWPEGKDAWDSGAITKLPLPYYGLQTADFVGGHCSYVFGEYINWLREKDASMLPAARGEEKLEDLTEACGGESAYKSALPEDLHYNRYIAEKTCEFIEARSADNHPFFCWCSFPDPHHPFVATQPFCDMYDPAAMPRPKKSQGELDNLPPFYRIIAEEGASRWKCVSGRIAPTEKTDDQLRQIRALTYAMISSVDAALGRVLDRLDELGLTGNTAICLLSDHGDMLGDHHMLNKGPFHFEGLLRMPMIWSCPGHFSAGVRTPGLASQLDFAPTVLDLCGVSIPEVTAPSEPEAKLQRAPWPGKSLVSVLKGQEKKVRDWVIVENDEDYLGVTLRTFITNRYKITIYGEREDWGELFDLRSDPDEFRNLWHDPQSQQLKNALLAKFLHCYIGEDSPLPRRVGHA
jgi:arylsulfatase A-like enzyme